MRGKRKNSGETKMSRPRRFERPTYRSATCCSNPLSYGRANGGETGIRTRGRS